MKNAVVWSEIAVADLKRATAAGAKVILPKMALPGEQGFIAHVSDSEGNRIGLHAMG
jgi:predicted enzyme related to lactoylglutathione lyase